MPEVTITLKTIDESSKVVNKAKKEYEGLFPAVEKAGKGLGEFVSKNATAIAAIVGTGVALKKAYDEWQKYAQEVRDVALASGTTATEASKLLQVLDDYQISAQDVTAATRAMTKEGLVPTIDTLAQLSDEYLSITDAQERNEFVIKNLGRAGLQWVNVLNQGGEAIKAQSKEINKNLILTDEMIKDAERERLAMDALADTWQGFKVQLGAAVGELILYNEESKDTINRMQELDKISGKTNQNYRFLTDEQKAINAQLERGAAMTDAYNERLKQTGDIIEGEVLPSAEEMTDQFSDLISLTENIADETQNYNDEQQDLINKQNTVKKQIDDLIKKGYGPLSKEVQELQKEYDELGKESTQLASEHEKAMKRMQYDLISAKLAAGGLTEAEYELQIQVGETMGIFDRASANSARSMNRVAEAILQGKLKAQDFDRAMRLMEEHGYDIDIVLDVITNYAEGGGGGTHRMASGGTMQQGWNLLGDTAAGPTAFSELVYDPRGGAQVFNSRATQRILGSGMLGGFSSHALADEGGGGIFNPAAAPVVTVPRSRARRGGGSSVSIGDVSESPAPEELVEQVRAVQTEMRQETQRILRESTAVTAGKIDELISAVTDLAPRAIGKHVGFELSKVVG